MFKLLFGIPAIAFKLVVYAVGWPIQALLTSVERLIRGDPRDACPLFENLPETSRTDQIEDAWPPKKHPVAAVSVQDLMEANANLIRAVCYESTLNDDDKQRVLMPVIANLARLVHQVPGSEFDHHSGYGGLFTHALETAKFAAANAKNRIFDSTEQPKDRYFNGSRWILVAILASLAHDIGKPFTDMQITSADPDGLTWEGDIPILDWLRKHRIKSYCIDYLKDREHNRHKQASLLKSSLLIPNETWEFLGLTGRLAQMQTAFSEAVLKGREGGLIGRLLDNADATSRELDIQRQRRIRSEFKNVANPQADNFLKGIRSLIASGLWTSNRNAQSRVFFTFQGCFLVWDETTAKQARDEAYKLGAIALPSESYKLAELLVDSGVANRRNNDVTDAHSLFWYVTPILLGNQEFECLCIANPQMLFERILPVQIESVVQGIPADEDTKKAWIKQWGYVPVERISDEDVQGWGYTPDFIARMTDEAMQREAEREEQLLAVSSVLDAWAVANVSADSQSDAQPFGQVKESGIEDTADMAADWTPGMTDSDLNIANEMPVGTTSETPVASFGNFKTSKTTKFGKKARSAASSSRTIDESGFNMAALFGAATEDKPQKAQNQTKNTLAIPEPCRVVKQASTAHVAPLNSKFDFEASSSFDEAEQRSNGKLESLEIEPAETNVVIVRAGKGPIVAPKNNKNNAVPAADAHPSQAVDSGCSEISKETKPKLDVDNAACPNATPSSNSKGEVVIQADSQRKRKSRRVKAAEADRIYARTRQIVEEMAAQISVGSGLWLENGVEVDMNGCWSTASGKFEKELLESGIDEMVLKVVCEDMAKRGEACVELDRVKGRVRLVGGGVV